MLPHNNLNQHITQALGQKKLARIGIDLEDTFGNKGGMREYPRSSIVNMDYCEGVLLISYYHQEIVPCTEDNPVITEMIPWPRIKCLYFDEANVPSRIPFPPDVPKLHQL